MAVIRQGAVDNPGELVSRNTQSPEPLGDAHPPVEPLDLVSQVGRRRKTHGRLQPIEFIADLGSVETQDRRQQDRVESTVVQARLGQPAERVRERVHCAEAFLEGQAALQCAHHHLAADGEVASIVYGGLEIPPDAAGAVESDGFCGLIEAR